ncbi:MAG: endonuclease V [Planctomycetes bacterium]|nr:endonuclease V [Planctomycetota bacterium]
MILAVDVHYTDPTALAAGVTFSDWEDSTPLEIYTSQIEDVIDYESGSFYKRELPCILTLLKEHRLDPAIIVVDGFTYLDGVEKPGLGKHLFDALNKQVVIVGVAKRPFKDIDVKFEVHRGESKNPLYVTAEGMELTAAKAAISRMHGDFRIPDLLKKADQVCRGN